MGGKDDQIIPRWLLTHPCPILCICPCMCVHLSTLIYTCYDDVSATIGQGLVTVTCSSYNFMILIFTDTVIVFAESFIICLSLTMCNFVCRTSVHNYIHFTCQKQIFTLSHVLNCMWFQCGNALRGDQGSKYTACPTYPDHVTFDGGM